MARWRFVLDGVRISPCAVALLVAGACSAPTEPEAPPTLYLTNPLCDAANCKAIQVRAFVWEYNIPQQPIGLEVLGEVNGPSACLQFPDSWQITVSEVDADGDTVRSDTITSTMDDEIYLTLLDWDPGGDLIVGKTENLIPSSSPGWTLLLSENPDPLDPIPFAAELAATAGCS